jgi:hypothetical protein
MRGGEPLPRWVFGALGVALVAMAGLAALLALARPTLRQGRLISEATHVCEARTAEAADWLTREPELVMALERERRDAAERAPFLLHTDDEVVVRTALTSLAEGLGLEVLGFRLGTVRGGEAFDTVPASLKVAGDRAELPPLLAAFYAERRVVRLVALDLEAPEYGTERMVATLRWEFASPVRSRAAPQQPEDRWAPPAVAATPEAAVASWNQGRWSALEEAVVGLRALGPELRRVAALEAERAALEQERRALARWRDASESERRAVLRKVPLLLRRLGVSAVGRAGLRPGPGGTLQIIDDD